MTNGRELSSSANPRCGAMPIGPTNRPTAAATTTAPSPSKTALVVRPDGWTEGKDWGGESDISIGFSSRRGLVQRQKLRQCLGGTWKLECRSDFAGFNTNASSKLDSTKSRFNRPPPTRPPQLRSRFPASLPSSAPSEKSHRRRTLAPARLARHPVRSSRDGRPPLPSCRRSSR